MSDKPPLIRDRDRQFADLVSERRNAGEITMKTAAYLLHVRHQIRCKCVELGFVIS
jgi:hypothetical protein